MDYDREVLDKVQHGSLSKYFALSDKHYELLFVFHPIELVLTHNLLYKFALSTLYYVHEVIAAQNTLSLNFEHVRVNSMPFVPILFLYYGLVSIKLVRLEKNVRYRHHFAESEKLFQSRYDVVHETTNFFLLSQQPILHYQVESHLVQHY